MGDDNLGQGRENVIEYLFNEKALANELENKLRKIIFESPSQDSLTVDISKSEENKE